MFKLLFILLALSFGCKEPDTGIEVPPPPTDQTDPQGPTDPQNPDPSAPEGGYIIVGYAYADSGTLPDPTLLTHINFSFAKIQDDFETLYIRDKKANRLKQIVGLKSKKPSLKVLLSVGGWGAGNFSEMAADETHRKNFCKNCLSAVNTYKLDGIDLDWEYPTSNSAGISCSPNDTRNFTLLLKDLRDALGPDKLITMASEAGANYIDWASALPYLDFVNIMSYDMGKPPYHNAALYPSSKTKMSCDEAVAKHYAKGVPYNKMTLGMAFFGRVDRQILKGDELDYNEIIKLTGYTECWDDVAKVPYLATSAGTMVLSYDNATSIGLKADYIKQKGLLGGMYWDIEADDADWTLAKAVATRLLSSSTSDEDDPDAFRATNQYVEKFLEEVDYGDSEYTYSSVKGYPGGGPSNNNEEVPPTYTISWTASSSAQKLVVWEGNWSREYSLAAGVGKQDITNLVPRVTYNWQVTSTSDNSIVGSGSFKTRGHLHQVYFAPEVRNGRDLGGYKGLGGKTVVYRMLYRGGKIHGKYCSDAGRDRTATLALLLEGALGVSESDMAKDYELTYFTPTDWGMSKDDNGNYTLYKHTRDSYSYKSLRETIFEEIPSGTYQERIAAYIVKIGVPQKDIDDLRSIMLR